MSKQKQEDAQGKNLIQMKSCAVTHSSN